MLIIILKKTTLKKSFIKSVLYSTVQQMPIYLRNQSPDLEYSVQCTHSVHSVHITQTHYTSPNG